MPAMFEELLEKTMGFPREFCQDLRNRAETLEVIAFLAKIDVEKESRYVLDHLPDLRKEHARSLQRDAKRMKTAASKVAIVNTGWMGKSVMKMSLPDIDDGYRHRAVLIELSVQIKSRLRGVMKTEPELDPERLKKFNWAMDAIIKGLLEDVGSWSECEAIAYMTFSEELWEARYNTDLAVDNFARRAFLSVEHAHCGDVLIDGVVASSGRETDQSAQALRMQNPVTQKTPEGERSKRVGQNAILQDMPKIAAEHLNAKEYAAYWVMIENKHLLHWEIEDGSVRK
jgi:nuclear transport factor 2 (NTF2) superfamily protein